MYLKLRAPVRVRSLAGRYIRQFFSEEASFSFLYFASLSLRRRAETFERRPLLPWLKSGLCKWVPFVLVSRIMLLLSGGGKV